MMLIGVFIYIFCALILWPTWKFKLQLHEIQASGGFFSWIYFRFWYRVFFHVSMHSIRTQMNYQKKPLLGHQIISKSRLSNLQNSSVGENQEFVKWALAINHERSQKYRGQWPESQIKHRIILRAWYSSEPDLLLDNHLVPGSLIPGIRDHHGICHRNWYPTPDDYKRIFCLWISVRREFYVLQGQL